MAASVRHHQKIVIRIIDSVQSLSHTLLISTIYPDFDRALRVNGLAMMVTSNPGNPPPDLNNDQNMLKLLNIFVKSLEKI